MLKKSTSKKLKSIIYPLAFILIILLSAVYKLVFKGNADLRITAFKSGKTASVTESSGTADQSDDSTDVSASAVSTVPVVADGLTVQTSDGVKKVSVYICGEVMEPGIYIAPSGVILNDIIEDAGGLTSEASVNNINLVYQVTCNMSIYIPSVEETSHGFVGGEIIRQDGVYVWGAQSGSSADTAAGSTVTVNINTATETELKSLPGIGDVTAKAIIDYRKSKPFEKPEDIKNVTGIGDSKYNRIKDYICV